MEISNTPRWPLAERIVPFTVGKSVTRGVATFSGRVSRTVTSR
jgi:hypothetical protein